MLFNEAIISLVCIGGLCIPSPKIKKGLPERGKH
jgi:hypothetical protein